MPCVCEVRNTSNDQVGDLRPIGRSRLGSAISVSREEDFFRQLFRETQGSSKFLERQRRFELLKRSLIGLTSLSQGWDSYDSQPPSTAATRSAVNFLRKLYDGPLLPSSIVPSAEGGVALYFLSGDRNAYAEFRNSGELVLALYDHETDPIVRELSSSDADEFRAIELLRSYFA
jgi:hypothetical protein